MPVKMIGILLLVVLVAVLTGFNIENTCTIWFFHNFSNIPVFAALLGAFLAGVIVTIPFTFMKSSLKSKKDSRDKKKEKIPETKIPAVKEEEPLSETKSE